MKDSPARTLARTIRDRRVIPWTLAYLMGAWVLLEATSFLAGEFDGPEWIVPVLTVILAFGTFSAITFAWYHGAAGWQRITRREGLIHGVILATLLGAFWAGPPLSRSEPVEADALPITRVAVLYFKDHSEGAQLTPLSRDLTEAVVHRLAQVPALDVLPLTAVEEFRGARTPMDSIVARLRAGTLMEGSLTVLGGEIVVTAQLIEAATGVHRDSWVFSQPVDRPASVVTDVADSIGYATRAAIGRQVREHDVEASATVPEARALYRRARAILEDEARPVYWEDARRGIALLEDADRLLQEAERLDPGWAEPILLRVDVAELHSRLVGGAGSVDGATLATAIHHTSRALPLVPDSARVLERRGLLRLELSEHSEAKAAAELRTEAEADLRAASRMEGDRPHAWWGLSNLLELQGRFGGAQEYARKAYETDSFLELTEEVLQQLTTTALNLERLDEAEDWCNEGLRLLPGNQTFAHLRLLILASLPAPRPEDVERAWAYADTLARGAMPDRESSWRAMGEILVAATLAGAGEADSARAVLRRAGRVLARSGSPDIRAAGHFYEARARLQLGEYETVLNALRRYVDQYAGRAEGLATEWWFRELWDDPRFMALHGATATEAAGSD